MCHLHGLQDSLKQFRAGDPLAMARKSGASYDEAIGRFTLQFCNQILIIDWPTGIIQGERGEEISDSHRIIIYQYLAQASGASLAGRWISYLELPNGEHHYGPFKMEAIDPLARIYGHNLQGFGEAARQLGGQEVAMGHAGFVLPVFPRLPVAVILWEGDDEFPPAANMIFDASAASYLTPATLYVLGINVTRKLCGQPPY